MSSRYSLARRFAPVRPAISPDEVRAARASAGWTLEEAADVMEVLPLEVAAWEAGTIAPTRAQAAMFRWHVAVAPDENRALAAGVIPCGWMEDRSASIERQLSGDPDMKVIRALEREAKVHVPQCPECRRWEVWRREHPLPPHPGESGWMELMLMFLLALLMFPAMIAVASRGVFPVLEPFLALFVGAGILLKVREPTRPLAEEHPVAANCLRAAAVVLPLLVLAWFRGWVSPGAPEAWASAGELVLMAGAGIYGVVSLLRPSPPPPF